eukprot:Skav228416  [mRNA]  locus=scaffold1325:124751:127567:+ [translate_table: standard]
MKHVYVKHFAPEGQEQTLQLKQEAKIEVAARPKAATTKKDSVVIRAALARRFVTEATWKQARHNAGRAVRIDPEKRSIGWKHSLVHRSRSLAVHWPGKAIYTVGPYGRPGGPNSLPGQGPFASIRTRHGTWHKAGFDHIEIVAKSPGKHGLNAWFFRALRKDQRVQVPIRLGEETDESPVYLTAVRDFRKRPANKEPVLLRREKGTSFVAPQRHTLHHWPFPGASDSQQEPEAAGTETIPDAPMDSAQSQTEGQTENGKRPSVQPSQDSRAKKPKKIEMPKGAQIVPNDGGGNCLFHSLASATSWIQNKNRTHRQIRAALVSTMQTHADTFAAHWDQRMPDDKVTTKTFEDYPRALEKSLELGGASLKSAFLPSRRSTSTETQIWLTSLKGEMTPALTLSSVMPASIMSANSSVAEEPSHARKTTTAAGAEDKRWVCDKCSLILRSKSTSHLSAKRMAHIRKHHADLPRTFFHQIQPRQTIIPASHGLSLSTGGWQCAWCDKRLPPLPVGQRKASAKAHLKQCPQAPKQATMSQNAKALLPKLGYDPQASPAQVASMYAKAGRFEEIRNSSSHDLTPVGPMGRHASFACSRCCRYWCRIDVLRDCHDATECSSHERKNNILQRIATLQKMSVTKKNRVIQCWKLTHAEKELVRKAARTESSDPCKQLSKMSGHSIIAVPTPQEKVRKFSYTCQKCTGQWRAWSQAKRQANAVHCQKDLRMTNLRAKRRWWERVRPITRAQLMNAWKLTASEKAILDSAPGLTSKQCG